MFQSLFSWMLLWKTDERNSFFTVLGCFNPCSLGCCSESLYPLGSYYYCPVSILVLLDVALKGFYLQLGHTNNRSFNPCSLGCCSERSISEPTPVPFSAFQSLFSWMLLWKNGIRDRFNDRYKVSILVLLDVALKDTKRLTNKISKNLFQSLFSWMLLWKKDWCTSSSSNSMWFQSLFSWMLLWKSLGLWAVRIVNLCFNPCSLGCCSERLRKMSVTMEIILCFNPCSLGCCSERR